MASTQPLPVAVLVSGRGSNLRALADAIDAGTCDARIAGVVADRARCAALDFARERALPTRVVRPKDHADRAAWDAALAEAVGALAPDLVVLAGFMRLVGDAFLAGFGGRTVNVHPSLLPAFPGLDAPGQAVTAGVRISGCTVHLVDAGVDTGPILAQAAVPVRPDDDAARLHARIQPLEHRLLPRVVDWVARGRLELGGEPRWTGPAASDGALFSPDA
ncbi:MAG TPA: phosphoribosylglycinamide formyltransferase [Sandaracinaceae bacterium LLY-WYZ-13_1]|nr:phosphoribosylglycinamide formyltransferase [Sandaracinaceae bacterium LLY-WYZ-13_1]